MKRILLVLLLFPVALYAASFTVEKSMVASSGSFTTAGFTDPSYTYGMSNNIVAGFSANITTGKTVLSTGGITNIFTGSFIFKNCSADLVVNLYLNASATVTQAVLQPGHSVCIDGAVTGQWAAVSAFASTNAVPTNNTALCSWAWADQ